MQECCVGRMLSNLNKTALQLLPSTVLQIQGLHGINACPVSLIM